MKLFQIEEPDGTPPADDGPGAAVGIDLSPEAGGAVAIAIGGNAELLTGRDGERRLAFDPAALEGGLLALRERAEKALARPVTHAVIASPGLDGAALDAAARAAGLVVLRVVDRAAAAALADGSDAAVLGAAIQAEDDAAGLLPR
jgi:hypothetical protein